MANNVNERCLHDFINAGIEGKVSGHRAPSLEVILAVEAEPDSNARLFASFPLNASQWVVGVRISCLSK